MAVDNRNSAIFPTGCKVKQLQLIEQLIHCGFPSRFQWKLQPEVYLRWEKIHANWKLGKLFIENWQRATFQFIFVSTLLRLVLMNIYDVIIIVISTMR